MAQQGSGLGKGPDDGAFTNRTSFDARSGSAKRIQTEFAQKWGMKDADGSDESKEDALNASPSNPGTGPLADSPRPLDLLTPEQRGKTLRRQPSPLQSKWGMVDANGKGVDGALGGKVLGEAILSGAASLPVRAK
jgi:hypothetical protein